MTGYLLAAALTCQVFWAPHLTQVVFATKRLIGCFVFPYRSQSELRCTVRKRCRLYFSSRPPKKIPIRACPTTARHLPFGSPCVCTACQPARLSHRNMSAVKRLLEMHHLLLHLRGSRYWTRNLTKTTGTSSYLLVPADLPHCNPSAQAQGGVS